MEHFELLLQELFSGVFLGRYSLQKYELCRRKSKLDTHFTLTPFLQTGYLQPFCPTRLRDGT